MQLWMWRAEKKYEARILVVCVFCYTKLKGEVTRIFSVTYSSKSQRKEVWPLLWSDPETSHQWCADAAFLASKGTTCVPGDYWKETERGRGKKNGKPWISESEGIPPCGVTFIGHVGHTHIHTVIRIQMGLLGKLCKTLVVLVLNYAV